MNTAPITSAMTPTTSAAPELYGLVQPSACESVEDLSQLVTPLLVEKFKFKGDAAEALEVQVHFFLGKNDLGKNDIFNDKVCAHMATSYLHNK